MININNNNLPAVLLATSNHGKLREYRSLLQGLPIRFVEPGELSLQLEVDESGETYAENAAIKARAYQRASGLTALADDTGLEVAALGGAPGVHSARFSPLPGATDADRRTLLLATLAGKPRPWLARFCCVTAVAFPGREVQLFHGSVEGEIIAEERGEGGFGYDKLFWISSAGKTMSELGIAEKNKVSHRAVAVKQAIPYLLGLFANSD